MTQRCLKYSDGAEIWVDEYHMKHRTDGPAFMRPDKSVLWFIRGQIVNSAEEYRSLTRLSNEDVLALILKYGPIQ